MRIAAGWATCVIVLVLAGCGSGTTTQAESTTTTQAESTRVSSDDSARTSRVSDEVRTLGGGGTDGETTWYRLIDSLEVHGSSLEVRTSLYPDDGGREIAKDICNVLNANLVIAKTADFGLETVTVYAQEDPVSYTSSPMSGHC